MNVLSIPHKISMRWVLVLPHHIKYVDLSVGGSGMICTQHEARSM